MAALLRLDIPWSARPQLNRRATVRSSRIDPDAAGLTRAGNVMAWSAPATSGKRRRERQVALPPEQVVQGAGVEQFANAPQPDEAGGGEVVVAEPVRGVRGEQLADPLADA